MQQIFERIRTEWPAWMVASYMAFLPIRRLSEAPLLLLALMFPLLAIQKEYRHKLKPAIIFIGVIFLCYWIPMLASSFDTFDPNKSWYMTWVAIRFPMAAMTIALLLQDEKLLWRFLQICSFVLLLWGIDGFVQLIFGKDLFGVPMHEDRLNALFNKRYQFYGPMLAILSPLLLEYARRRWPAWAWVTAFSITLGAVFISGMRSGWLMMLLIMAGYAWMAFRQQDKSLRKSVVMVPVLALGIFAISYVVSPLVQERVKTTLSFSTITESALDEASSYRIPIFTASLKMYREHPINGIGLRAYPFAYAHYAPPGDVHMENEYSPQGATHAHNVVLEVMSDTGTIGLVFWLLGVWAAVYFWRKVPKSGRQKPLPFVFALIVMLFPLNSYFSIYGVYMSSTLWWLLGLWASTLPVEES